MKTFLYEGVAYRRDHISAISASPYMPDAPTDECMFEINLHMLGGGFRAHTHVTAAQVLEFLRLWRDEDPAPVPQLPVATGTPMPVTVSPGAMIAHDLIGVRVRWQWNPGPHSTYVVGVVRALWVADSTPVLLLSVEESTCGGYPTGTLSMIHLGLNQDVLQVVP